MTKAKSTALSRRIEACKKRIAAERDKLRDLIDDAKAVEECCDEAEIALTEAADALSRYL